MLYMVNDIQLKFYRPAKLVGYDLPSFVEDDTKTLEAFLGWNHQFCNKLIRDSNMRNIFMNQLDKEKKKQERFDETTCQIIESCKERITFEIKQFDRFKKNLKYIPRERRKPLMNEILDGLMVSRDYLDAFTGSFYFIQGQINKADLAIQSAIALNLDADEVAWFVVRKSGDKVVSRENKLPDQVRATIIFKMKDGLLLVSFVGSDKDGNEDIEFQVSMPPDQRYYLYMRAPPGVHDVKFHDINIRNCSDKPECIR